MVIVAKDEDVKNYNFALPPEIGKEFRKIGDVNGEKNKVRWAVAAAAVLKLLELPRAEIELLVETVIGRRHKPARMKELVDEALAKAAQRERERHSISSMGLEEVNRAAQPGRGEPPPAERPAGGKPGRGAKSK